MTGQVPVSDESNAPPRTGPQPTKSNSDVMIAVMGATGTGKTTFINTASGSGLRIGKSLGSCTFEVQLTKPFELDGHSVTLIDTPGFDDTVKSDYDILKLITDYLSSSYEQGTLLAGVIYIHRISDYRFSGMSGRNFRLFRMLCGESTLRNVVLVTNMWGTVPEADGVAREAELQEKYFKTVLDKGAKMLRHYDTADSSHNILRHILKNRPEPLKVQKEMVDEKKDLSQTEAGEELNRELQKLIKKHDEEMAQLRKEMADAVKRQDEETRKELADEHSKLKTQLEQVRNDQNRLTSQYMEALTRQEMNRQPVQESQGAADDKAKRAEKKLKRVEGQKKRLGDRLLKEQKRKEKKEREEKAMNKRNLAMFPVNMPLTGGDWSDTDGRLASYISSYSLRAKSSKDHRWRFQFIPRGNWHFRLFTTDGKSHNFSLSHKANATCSLSFTSKSPKIIQVQVLGK